MSAYQPWLIRYPGSCLGYTELYQKPHVVHRMSDLPKYEQIPNSFSPFFSVTDDHAIEAGNIASSSNHSYPITEQDVALGEGDVRLEQKDQVQQNREQWLMNYQEAAIYLEEGRNNEKFDTHPRNQSALPAYLIGIYKAVKQLNYLMTMVTWN